jgi:hypothetical protein
VEENGGTGGTLPFIQFYSNQPYYSPPRTPRMKNVTISSISPLSLSTIRQKAKLVFGNTRRGKSQDLDTRKGLAASLASCLFVIKPVKSGRNDDNGGVNCFEIIVFKWEEREI